VVIAVIALLMAVLLPALQRARKQAKGVACHANLRQWGMTLELYTEDNEGRLPADLSGYCGIWLFRGASLRGDPNAPDDSMHHFSTRDLVCCPLAIKPNRGRGFTGAAVVKGTMGSAFGAWEITSPGRPFQGSYGFNMHLFDTASDILREGLSPSVRLRGLDISSLRGRPDYPILLDAALPWAGPDALHPPPRTEEPRPILSLMDAFCINRHNGYVNGLFLDWSLRKVGLKELWTLRWSRNFDRAGHWTRAGGIQPDDWPEWMRQFKDY
jgi:prepilin-type processing-associated H-X9-DG protein